MKKSFLLILLLLLLLFVGGVHAQKIVPFPGLGKPDSITIDDQRLYITDQGTIAVYSLEDFKLKKKFGRQGEGPGEFRILPFDRICLRISLSHDTILVNSVSRLSFFTEEGKMVPFAESEFLCAYPYTITKGALYQLNENPDTEEWELRITNLYGNK